MKTFKQYLEETFTHAWWKPQRRLSEPEEAKRKLKYIGPTARTGSSPTPFERRVSSSGVRQDHRQNSEIQGHLIRPVSDISAESVPNGQHALIDQPTRFERRAALDPGFGKASEKEGHMVRPRPDVGRDTIGLRTRKTATGKKVAKETEKLDPELPWGAWKPPTEENAHWSSPSHPLSPQSIIQGLLARRRKR